MSLSNKYRPASFNEVVGQQSTIKILKKQLQTGSIKNSYLFCGSSGSGKTTLARIFAKELNGVDNSAIELDAASHNGVSEIRELVDSANEKSLAYKYKIYIIDECHTLTSQSWQVFLKTIEEPSKYTIFIFCTTEPDKVPDTIKNRCQRFNITKIPSSMICDRLKYICCQEGYTSYEDVCDYISRNCKNQMRDAISILEQTADVDNNLNMDDAISISGGIQYQFMFDIINSIIDRDMQRAIVSLNQLFLNSIDAKAVAQSLLELELDINKYIVFNTMSQVNTPLYYENEIKNCVNFDNPGAYHSYILNNLLDLCSIDDIDRNIIEAYIIKMVNGQ